MKKIIILLVLQYFTVTGFTQSRSHKLNLSESYKCSSINTKAYFFIKNSSWTTDKKALIEVYNRNHPERVKVVSVIEEGKTLLTLETPISSSYLPQYLSKKMGISYQIKSGNNTYYVIDVDMNGVADYYMFEYENFKTIIFYEENLKYEYVFAQENVAFCISDGTLIVAKSLTMENALSMISDNTFKNYNPKNALKIGSELNLSSVDYISAFSESNNQYNLLFTLPNQFSDVKQMAYYKNNNEITIASLTVNSGKKNKIIYFDKSIKTASNYYVEDENNKVTEKGKYIYNSNGTFNRVEIQKPNDPSTGEYFDYAKAEIVNLNMLSKNILSKVSMNEGKVGPFKIGDHITRWASRLVFKEISDNGNLVVFSFLEENSETNLGYESARGFELGFSNNRLALIRMDIDRSFVNYYTAEKTYGVKNDLMYFFSKQKYVFAECDEEILMCTPEYYKNKNRNDVFRGEWTGIKSAVNKMYSILDIEYDDKIMRIPESVSEKELNDWLDLNYYVVDLIANKVISNHSKNNDVILWELIEMLGTEGLISCSKNVDWIKEYFSIYYNRTVVELNRFLKVFPDHNYNYIHLHIENLPFDYNPRYLTALVYLPTAKDKKVFKKDCRIFEENDNFKVWSKNWYIVKRILTSEQDIIFKIPNNNFYLLANFKYEYLPSNITSSLSQVKYGGVSFYEIQIKNESKVTKTVPWINISK